MIATIAISSGNDAGDERPEDDQQDDQRGGQPEVELAVLEVLLRELREVLVRRVGPGDRDGVRAPAERLHVVDHVRDGAVAGRVRA